jgi:hypothetical protein
MKFVKGETVRVADLRNNHIIPSGMKMYSGQAGKIVEVFDSPDNLNVYYTITVDDGRSVWPETLLAKATGTDDDFEEVFKLIAECEGKLDEIKRVLWRKKHYSETCH